MAKAKRIYEYSYTSYLGNRGFIKVLEDGKDKFIESCKELESTTGLSGISITVSFEYNGEQIASQTYSSAD